LGNLLEALRREGDGKGHAPIPLPREGKGNKWNKLGVGMAMMLTIPSLFVEGEMGMTIQRRERSLTMAIFFLCLRKSCCGGHGISSREEEVCSSYSKEEGKDDHGHLAQ
jgi:hypothetical protein